MIRQVHATAITCDHDPGEGNEPCESRLLAGPGLTNAQARVVAADRGWDPDTLRCPKHRPTLTGV